MSTAAAIKPKPPAIPPPVTAVGRRLGRLASLCRRARGERRRRLLGALLAANEPIVRHFVNAYLASRPGFAAMRDDLEQAGRMGLLRAVEVWDGARGSWSTCATLRVRQYVGREFEERSALVRVPVCLRDRLRRHRRDVKAGAGDGDPTNADPYLTAARVALAPPMRLDYSRYLEKLGTGVPGYDPSWGLADDRPDADPADAADAAQDAARRCEMVRAALGRLTDRQRAVVAHRFGLDGVPTLTQREAGERIGISRARVQQIELSALKKLRKELAELAD